MRAAVIAALGLLTGCNNATPDHLRSLAHTAVTFAYHCQRGGKTERECHKAIDESLDKPL